MNISVVAETICLVCTNPPGDNPLGLCNGHYFQYMVMCAAGQREEFVRKMDKEDLIGRVRYRQQYEYGKYTTLGGFRPAD